MSFQKEFLVSILLVNILTGFAFTIRQKFDDGGPQPSEKKFFFEKDNGNIELVTMNRENVNRHANVTSDVGIWLYTRDNQNIPFRLEVDDIAILKKSSFDSTINTKFIIHGFTDSLNSTMIQNIKNAYLIEGNYNIIAIDWGVLAAGPNYYEASRNTRIVGQYLSEFIDFLVFEGNTSLNQIHLIGHSLGAHVAGISGKNLKSGLVSRITALDAALPLYEDAKSNWRITKNDAVFVDAIHSCGGYLGFEKPVGHSDFYPNGGKYPQPGCELDVTGSCSHARSWKYYAESISDEKGFPATECDSLKHAETGKCNLKVKIKMSQDDENDEYMGDSAYLVNGTISDLYYTKTNKNPPFATNQIANFV